MLYDDLMKLASSVKTLEDSETAKDVQITNLKTQVASLQAQVTHAQSQIPATPMIGACLSFDDCKTVDDAKRIKALCDKAGIKAVRAFGSSCRAGGAFDAGSFNAAKRLLDTGLTVIGMHGGPELKAGKTYDGTNNLEDYRKYFDALAKIIEPYPNYWVELQNEANLKNQYWPYDPNLMPQIAAVARRSLGAKRKIVGPSVGWGADTKPHLDCWQSWINGGILDSIDYVNTHLYATSNEFVVTVLSGLTKMMQDKGKVLPIALTETNVTDAKNYKTLMPVVAKTLNQYGVLPVIYRLYPKPIAPYDTHSIYGLDKTTPNQDTWTAWNLKE